MLSGGVELARPGSGSVSWLGFLDMLNNGTLRRENAQQLRFRRPAVVGASTDFRIGYHF
jgi:hypothetical protein